MLSVCAAAVFDVNHEMSSSQPSDVQSNSQSEVNHMLLIMVYSMWMTHSMLERSWRDPFKARERIVSTLTLQR
jgi:hypothetical protein